MASSKPCERLRTRLVGFALGLPEAWEDHPWGEVVAKVGKKVFVFFGQPSTRHCVALSVKLPDTGPDLLNERFAEPTGYGLGRGGWVTLTLPTARTVPFAFLEDLIVESYCAVAPKRLAGVADSQRARGGSVGPRSEIGFEGT